MRLRRDLRHDDRGVTLTEVLVAVAILGIIVVPLGNALIGFIRHTDDTTRRLSESHDVQLAAAYFAQDVQSVGVRNWSAHPYPLQQSIEQNVARDAGLFPCGGSGTPTAFVRFGWDDPASASAQPTLVKVAYVVQTVGGERQLRRVKCQGASATPVSETVLVHNLDAADSSPAAVSCSTSCTSASVPQSVTLTLKIKGAASTGSVITVSLPAQRRQT